MLDYNKKNSHHRDTLLSFNSDDHTYSINGNPLQSVTNFVENCFKKFDVDFWAPKLAVKHGVTEHELRSQWEAKAESARRLGTLMHSKIEQYYLGVPQESDSTFRLFEKFSSDFQLNPYRTEWAIFDEELGIAGTLDFLDYSNGEFTIFDWKRTDKIVDNGKPVTLNKYGKSAFYPISHIPDTTYWHYALQVSIYRYILEKNYDINVNKGKLAIFHPKYEKYHIVEVPYLKQEIERLFAK